MSSGVVVVITGLTSVGLGIADFPVVAQGGNEFGRHWRRGRVNDAQAAPIATRSQRRTDHVVDHGRHTQELRGPIPRDLFQDRLGLEAAGDEGCSSRRKHAQHAVDEPPAVKQGRGDEQPVLGPKVHAGKLAGIVPDVQVREHNSLGMAGGARRVQQSGQRVRRQIEAGKLRVRIAHGGIEGRPGQEHVADAQMFVMPGQARPALRVRDQQDGARVGNDVRHFLRTEHGINDIRHDTRFESPDGCDQQLRPTFEEQGDDVPGLDSARAEMRREAIGEQIEFRVAVRAALEEQRRMPRPDAGWMAQQVGNVHRELTRKRSDCQGSRTAPDNLVSTEIMKFSPRHRPVYFMFTRPLKYAAGAGYSIEWIQAFPCLSES
jgi:hypothetical protein